MLHQCPVSLPATPLLFYGSSRRPRCCWLQLHLLLLATSQLAAEHAAVATASRVGSAAAFGRAPCRSVCSWPTCNLGSWCTCSSSSTNGTSTCLVCQAGAAHSTNTLHHSNPGSLRQWKLVGRGAQLTARAVREISQPLPCTPYVWPLHSGKRHALSKHCPLSAVVIGVVTWVRLLWRLTKREHMDPLGS